MDLGGSSQCRSPIAERGGGVSWASPRGICRAEGGNMDTKGKIDARAHGNSEHWRMACRGGVLGLGFAQDRRSARAVCAVAWLRVAWVAM